jgi:hypothetical protein
VPKLSAPYYICSLRPLWTLDNFELNRISFIQGFVSLACDCRVVDKYIWTVIAPDEAVAFRIIEPLDCAFHLYVVSAGDANGMPVWKSIIHPTPSKLN